MRWWWFGPSVTKAEIERELRVMKEGGIGGVEVQPVYPVVLEDPAGGIKTRPFLSDDFIEALRFSTQKARELGLRFDLTLGSGWPYGGPTVSIGEAAARLRVERINVPENSRRVAVPGIGAGEKLLAVFAARAEGKSIAADTLREITEIRDGAVVLPEGAPRPVQVQFFIASRTGMQVKRPAVGSEGFVLDHLDRASVENYLNRVGDRLMRAFDASPPHAVFCDSLEVYNSDWTRDFLEEFQRRRGYDLKPHLPALEEFIPYLEQIWDNRQLTNGGPFHRQLEQALCDYLGVEHLCLFANGTLALLTAIQALDLRGEVITRDGTDCRIHLVTEFVVGVDQQQGQELIPAFYVPVQSRRNDAQIPGNCPEGQCGGPVGREVLPAQLNDVRNGPGAGSLPRGGLLRFLGHGDSLP